MKKTSGGITCRFIFVLFLSFMQAAIWAQDSTTSSHSVTVTKETTTTTNWYMQPWVWAVGAAVFIIILVALFRGGNSNKTTDVSRSTTVIKTDREV